MHIKEITVVKSFTRNLGNFESTRIEYGAVVSLDEGDDHEVARKKAKATVEGWIVEDVEEVDADRS